MRVHKQEERIVHDRLGFFCSPRECEPRISLIYSCKRDIFPLSLLNFPHAYDMEREISGGQRVSLSTNFPSLTRAGKLVDKEILCFSLLNIKFPVSMILKVFLGDHSIAK